MKKAFFLLLISAFFAACNGDKKKAIKDSVITHLSVDARTAEIIKKFGPFVQGAWVASGYMDTLSKTRSPMQSDGELGGVAAFEIGLPDGKSDSTHIGYSLGNHEGADFVLYFRTGQRPNSLKTNLTDYEVNSDFFELGYEVMNNDTSLQIYHYNKSKKIINSVKYTKVANKAADENDAAWGIQYITNKILMAGRYMMNDSTGVNRAIIFNDAGKVTGFSGFETFYVNTDFTVEPENSPDEIIFDLYGKNKKAFVFKFNADTLKLFEDIEKGDTIVAGQLKYKLVRKK